MFSVSVIIPSFNSALTIANCIKSVLCQNLQSIEVVFVNDGSTDESLAIVKEISKKDNRVVVLSKSNGGVSLARNYGMKHARGEYIAFVDADDIVKPDMYNTLYTKAREHDADLIFTGISKNGVKRYDLPNCFNIPMHRAEIRDSFLAKYIEADKNYRGYRIITPGVWRVLYRRKFLEEYNIVFSPHIRYHEDLLFNLKAIAKADKIIIDDNHFYDYKAVEPDRKNRHSHKKIAKSHWALINEIHHLSQISPDIFSIDLVKFKTLNLSYSCIFNSCVDYGSEKEARINFIKQVVNDDFVRKCLKSQNSSEILPRLRIYRGLIIYRQTFLLVCISWLIQKWKD